MRLDGLLKSDITKIRQMAEHAYHDELEKLVVELYVLIDAHGGNESHYRAQSHRLENELVGLMTTAHMNLSDFYVFNAARTVERAFCQHTLDAI